MMIKYSILNKNIYINPVNFTYSFNEEDLQGIVRQGSGAGHEEQKVDWEAQGEGSLLPHGETLLR